MENKDLFILHCMADTMTADDLGMTGARSSAAMVLTHFPRVRVSASEVLTLLQIIQDELGQ